MKLRLPVRLLAAVVAAASHVAFLTVASASGAWAVENASADLTFTDSADTPAIVVDGESLAELSSAQSAEKAVATLSDAGAEKVTAADAALPEEIAAAGGSVVVTAPMTAEEVAAVSAAPEVKIVGGANTTENVTGAKLLAEEAALVTEYNAIMPGSTGTETPAVSYPANNAAATQTAAAADLTVPETAAASDNTTTLDLSAAPAAAPQTAALTTETVSGSTGATSSSSPSSAPVFMTTGATGSSASSRTAPPVQLVGAAGDAPAPAFASPITTLGNVMYIGDSITHGYDGRVSWRWDFFKLLTDNGVTQTEEGIWTGSSVSRDTLKGAQYGGATFANLHSAQSSGRTWEVSGRSAGERYDYSTIKNWLGFDDNKSNGQPYGPNGDYNGNVYSDTKAGASGPAPDAFFMLLGTNDVMSDSSGGANIDQVIQNLLGWDGSSFTGHIYGDKNTKADVEVIYDSMIQANSDAKIVMLTMPTVSGTGRDAQVARAMKFNDVFAKWVKNKNDNGANIILVDSNKGIIDVANTTVLNKGVNGMFADGLHPSAQGELIIAGNVAKTMGLGGRTAGQYRKAAADFAQNSYASGFSALPDGVSNVTLNDGKLDFGGTGASTATFNWDSADLTKGCTVEFSLSLGNGSTSGWDTTTNFAVTVADGTHSGVLNINEAYIMWGNTILYSQNNAEMTDPLRIAYVNGNALEGLDAGYYVWLGDMMIGENLGSTTASGASGVTLSYSGTGNALVSSLAMDGTGSFAPNTNRSYNAADAFVTAGAIDTTNTPQGNKTIDSWSTLDDRTFAQQTGSWARSASVTGAYTGAANNTTVSGDINMLYSGADNTGANQGVLAVFNNATVTTVNGNVYMQFDAPNATYGHWTGGGGMADASASLVATYNGTINGSYTAVINAGSFDSSVYGGAYNDTKSITGGSFVYINGGAIAGNLYGGGKSGTINNGTHVVVSGGSIAGSVYGGGSGGTITGGTSVTIRGGVIGGSVYGGFANETAGHYTGSVVVEDNLAIIKGGIYADTVTFKNVTPGDSKARLENYTGVVNATTSVTLDNYTAGDIRAAISTKALNAINNTATTVHNLTLTACEITVDSNSSLTLADQVTMGNTTSYTGNLRLADGIAFNYSAAAGSGAYSDGDNGFMNGSTYTLFSGNGLYNAAGQELAADNVATFRGAGNLNGYTFSYDNGTLTASGEGEQGTYYINTGTVVYGEHGGTGILTANKLLLQPSSSATLKLAQNLTNDCTEGIVVAPGSTGAVVQINQKDSAGNRIILDQSKLTANGSVTLKGSGTFALTGYTKPDSVVLDGNDWTGCVRISGSQKSVDLSSLATTNSWVEFYGFTGITNQWGGTNSQNIYLTNGTNFAWNFNDGTSTAHSQTASFTGKWAGTGTFQANSKALDFTFTNDISDWTGAFELKGSSTRITFQGQAKEVNASISSENSGRNGIEIKVDTDTTFNKNVSGVTNGLTVTAGHNATFNATTSISGTSSIGGTIYNNGTMTLAGTVNVDTTNMSAFDVYSGTDTTNRYDGTDGYTGSGHLTSDTAQFYLLKGTDASSLAGTYTISGVTAETKDNKSIVFSKSAVDLRGTYFVNGNLTWGGTMGDAATTGVAVARDAALTLNGLVGKNITGTGMVKIDYTSGQSYEYYNQSFLENFAGTVEIVSGNVQVGNSTNKFANATLKISGGELRGHSNTFTHDMILAGGGIADAGANETFSGNITLEADSFLGRDGGDKQITLSGNVAGDKKLTTRGNNTATFNFNGTTALNTLSVQNGTVNVNGAISATTVEQATNASNVYLKGVGETAQFTNYTMLKEGSYLYINGADVVVSETLQIGSSGNQGHLIMNSGSLKTKQINAWKQMDLQVLGGTLEFTGQQAFKCDYAADKYGHVYLGVDSNGNMSSSNAVQLLANDSAWRVELANNGQLHVGTVTIGGGNKQDITLVNAKLQGGTITNNSTLTLNGASLDAATTISGSGDTTGSGTWSGSGALTKVGTGTLTLSGANTFTGNVVVDGGTIKFGSSAALGKNNAGNGALSSRTITINQGASVDQNGYDNTCYAYVLNGGSLVNNGGGTSVDHIQSAKLELRANSSIGGTGNFYLINNGWGDTSVAMAGHVLEKTGGNTVYLYSTAVTGGGKLKISDGVLDIGRKDTSKTLSSLDADIELAKSGAISLNGTFSLADGRTLGSTVANARSTGNITLLGAVTLSAGSGDAMTSSGVLSGAGSVTKTGTGTVTLDAANTYLGGTTITEGTLVAAQAGALGTGAVALNGGVLDVTGLTSSLNTRMLTLDGGTLALGGSTLGLTNGLTLTKGTIDVTAMLNAPSVAAEGRSAGQSITLVSAGSNIGGSVDGIMVKGIEDTPWAGSTLSIDGSNLVLTMGNIADYIWNGGDGNWSDASWHTGTEQDVAFVNGSNAVFEHGTHEVTLTGNTAASRIILEHGAVLKVNKADNSLTGKLDGSGTYDLTGKELGTGLTLADSWTGTVRIANQELKSDNSNQKWISALRNENSWVEFSGFIGYDSSWASSAGAVWGDLTANIRLLDEGSESAWKFDASAGAGHTMYATGKWAGTGTFEFIGGSNQNVKYSGDISAWEGTLKSSSTDTRGVTFADAATEVNTDILGTNGTLNVNFTNTEAVTMSGDITSTDGTLNVTADAETTFSGNITGVTNLTVNKDSAFTGNLTNGKVTLQNGDTTFSGAVSGTQLAIGEGRTATLKATAASLGTVTGTGTLKYAGAGEGTVTMTVNPSGFTGNFVNASYEDLDLVVSPAGSTLAFNIKRDEDAGLVNLDLAGHNGDYTLKGVMDVHDITHATNVSLLVRGSGDVTASGSVVTGRLDLGAAADTGAKFTVSGADGQLTNGTAHVYSAKVEGYGTFAVADGATQTLSGNLTSFQGTMAADGADSVLTLNSSLHASADLNVKNGGKIVLGSAVTTLDSVSVTGEGSTLALSLKVGQAISVQSLTLGSGTTLDLSALQLTGDTDSAILVSSASAITTPDGGWGTVSLNFGSTWNADNEYSLTTNSSNQLVVDFNHPTVLIWNGGTNTWNVDGTQHWHTADATSTNLPFTTGSYVKFANGSGQVANVVENISAGKFTLDSGAGVTLNVGADKTLTTTDLVATGGASLTKTGTGTVHFGNKDNVADTLQNLTVSAGTVEFGGKVTVTGTGQALKITGSGSASFDGGLDVNNTLKLEGSASAIIGGTGTSAVTNLDYSATGCSVTVKKGATLGIKTNFWSRANTGISLETGASLEMKSTLKAVGLNTGDSGLKWDGNNGSNYELSHANYTYSHTGLTSLADIADLGNKLTNSTLSSGHNVTLTNRENNLTATTVTGGALVVNGTKGTASSTMQLGTVAVNAGTMEVLSAATMGNVTVGHGATLEVENTAVTMGTVAVTGGALELAGNVAGIGAVSVSNGGHILLGGSSYNTSITLDGSTMEAVPGMTLSGDLTFANGATLVLGGTANLHAHGTVTIGSGTTFDAANLVLDSGKITLLTGAQGLTGDWANVTLENLNTDEDWFSVTQGSDGNSLWLDVVQNHKEIIWDDASRSHLWVNGPDENWHESNNPGVHLAFEKGDRVVFANRSTAKLGSDVEANRLTIKNKASVTINSDAGYDLTVTHSVVGAGGTLVLNGTQDSETNVKEKVTVQALTLNNGTTTIGGRAEVARTLTVDQGGNVTVNGMTEAKAVVVKGGSTVNLAGGMTAESLTATDSTMTLGADSTVDNLVLNGSTLTNSAYLNAANERQPHDVTVSGSSTITGSGITDTLGIDLKSGASLTLTGGQTVNILTGSGITGTTAGNETLVINNATLTADRLSWNIANTVDKVQLDGTATFHSQGHTLGVETQITGSGGLVKTGSGVLELSATNTYKGDTEVREGTLLVSSVNALPGIATVKSGATLAISDSLTSAAVVDTLTVEHGGRLTLGGESLLNISGNLALNSGSTLDLTYLDLSAGLTKYTLATGGSFNLDPAAVNLTFDRGVHSVGDPGIAVENKDGVQTLVLNITLNRPHGLIWDGGTAAWDEGSTAHWHAAATSGESNTFARYDDVTFQNPTGETGASVAQVGGNVWAHDMTVKKGEAAKNAVTLDVAGGGKLTVDFLHAQENTSVTKTGAGTAEIGIVASTQDAETGKTFFGADLSVSNGTLTAQFIDMDASDGKELLAKGGVTRTGGVLNLVAGDGVHETDLVFDKTTSVTNVTRIETKEGANITFQGNTSMTNATGTTPVIYAAEGTEIRFEGTTNLSVDRMNFMGDGSVYLGENTTMTQTGGHQHILCDTVSVTLEKFSFDNYVTFILHDGTSLRIEELDMLLTNKKQIFYNGCWITEGETDRQYTSIGTLKVAGGDYTKSVGSISSKDTLNRPYDQQCGDYYIENLVSEGGNAKFMLANYAKSTYPGYDSPEVLYLGGGGKSDFHGEIMASDHNENGTFSGTEGHRKDTVIILRDETVAQDAVMNFDILGDYSDFGLGIEAKTVKIKGIKGEQLPSDDTFLVFSGSMSTKMDATYQSDDTVRTLEFVGEGEDYTSCAKIDKNLNLTKTGTGTQTFTSDSSQSFDGSIDVEKGVLQFLNNTSLHIEDLTLGVNGSHADNTLKIREDAAGSMVGMADVHGTMKAKAGAALDTNLTLNAGSVLDVSNAVTKETRQHEGVDSRTHDDYTGGLNMLENSLTLHSGISLSDTDVRNLVYMGWGDTYALAYNVGSFTLGGETYTADALGWSGEAIDGKFVVTGTEASKYLANLQLDDYFICYSGDDSMAEGGTVGAHVVYIVKVPEPATTTLSLLALAALCARRRRKA